MHCQSWTCQSHTSILSRTVIILHAVQGHARTCDRRSRDGAPEIDQLSWAHCTPAKPLIHVLVAHIWRRSIVCNVRILAHMQERLEGLAWVVLEGECTVCGATSSLLVGTTYESSSKGNP